MAGPGGPEAGARVLGSGRMASACLQLGWGRGAERRAEREEESHKAFNQPFWVSLDGALTHHARHSLCLSFDPEPSLLDSHPHDHRDRGGAPVCSRGPHSVWHMPGPEETLGERARA